MSAQKTHPRHHSLKQRDMIVSGVKKGITSIHGLIAQGRGEAFDYLIGEKTRGFSKKAIKASAAMLLAAKNPVISVNGNAAALCSKELVDLAKIVGAKMEINIFHGSLINNANSIKGIVANKITIFTNNFISFSLPSCQCFTFL